jgi:hypothetical protein
MDIAINSKFIVLPFLHSDLVHVTRITVRKLYTSVITEKEDLTVEANCVLDCTFSPCLKRYNKTKSLYKPNKIPQKQDVIIGIHYS